MYLFSVFMYLFCKMNDMSKVLQSRSLNNLYFIDRNETLEKLPKAQYRGTWHEIFIAYKLVPETGEIYKLVCYATVVGDHQNLHKIYTN